MSSTTPKERSAKGVVAAPPKCDYTVCPYAEAEGRISVPKGLAQHILIEESQTPPDHSGLYDWIDAQDVMRFLHVSPRTLQTLRRNGTLPFSRIGKKIFYLREDVARILAHNYTLQRMQRRAAL